MVQYTGRSIFSLALLVTAILSASFFAAGPTRAASIGAVAQTQLNEAKEYPYYVEFRVAVDGVYGHSYIAYGRLDRLGQPASATYADIHPTGDFLGMVLGHFFSMKAATIPEKDTLRLRPLSASALSTTPGASNTVGSSRSLSASALSTTPGAFSPTIATTSLPRWRAGWACRRRPRFRCLTISSRDCR